MPQEEVDKVTTVKAWWYSKQEYTKFTPAKKKKHYQLMQLKKAGKTQWIIFLDGPFLLSRLLYIFVNKKNCLFYITVASST